jgi:hypothetical protein
MRAAQREAERIIKATVKPPSGPTPDTRKIDAVLLHPVGRASDPARASCS